LIWSKKKSKAFGNLAVKNLLRSGKMVAEPGISGLDDFKLPSKEINNLQVRE